MRLRYHDRLIFGLGDLVTLLLVAGEETPFARASIFYSLARPLLACLADGPSVFFAVVDLVLGRSAYSARRARVGESKAASVPKPPHSQRRR